jgi:hypothetical protein
MAERFRDFAGGILGLLEQLNDDKKSGALERDLLEHGLRLRHTGSEEFTWRDLIVFVRESPQTSAFYRAVNPDTWMWTHEALLFAGVHDLLSIIAWQKTADGSKGRNIPEPLPRPGVTPKKHKVKGKATPLDQIKQKMADMRQRIKNNAQQQEVKVIRKRESDAGTSS